MDTLLPLRPSATRRVQGIDHLDVDRRQALVKAPGKYSLSDRLDSRLPVEGSNAEQVVQLLVEASLLRPSWRRTAADDNGRLPGAHSDRDVEGLVQRGEYRLISNPGRQVESPGQAQGWQMPMIAQIQVAIPDPEDALVRAQSHVPYSESIPDVALNGGGDGGAALAQGKPQRGQRAKVAMMRPPPATAELPSPGTPRLAGQLLAP